MSYAKGDEFLRGSLEKSQKYIKTWSSRFATFEAPSRKFSYGKSESKPASGGVMVVKKVYRASEKDPKLNLADADIFSFIVEGNASNGEEEVWRFRSKSMDQFHQWYFTIRHALAASSDMEPFHYGLPLKDPRTDLQFTIVPPDYLFRFSLLDRAIMYNFQGVKLYCNPDIAEPPEDVVLVIGDRSLYIFRLTADVHRCVPLVDIRKIYTTGTGLMGLVIPNEYDILCSYCHPETYTVLLRIQNSMQPSTKERYPPASVDTHDFSLAELHRRLNLQPPENYRINLIPPTPKSKLRLAMDLYEKQTGEKFVYGSVIRPPSQQRSQPASPDRAAGGGGEATAPKHASAGSDEATESADPMAVLLTKLGLSRYFVTLQQQHLDVEILSCMEPDDLESFGVRDPADRTAIVTTARGEPTSWKRGPRTDAEPSTEKNAESSPVMPVGGNIHKNGDGAPPAPAPKKAFVINLDSDDDDGAVATMPVPKKMTITLSDDEDDLGSQMPGQMKPPPGKKIVLDSESEDELHVVATAPKPAPKVVFGDDI